MKHLTLLDDRFETVNFNEGLTLLDDRFETVNFNEGLTLLDDRFEKVSKYSLLNQIYQVSNLRPSFLPIAEDEKLFVYLYKYTIHPYQTLTSAHKRMIMKICLPFHVNH
jgi:hypothetical protein